MKWAREMDRRVVHRFALLPYECRRGDGVSDVVWLGWVTIEQFRGGCSPWYDVRAWPGRLKGDVIAEEWPDRGRKVAV